MCKRVQIQLSLQAVLSPNRTQGGGFFFFFLIRVNRGAALTSRLYSSTRLSIVSFAWPEEPSIRLFSADRDRMRSSLAERAMSNSFTLECKAAVWKKRTNKEKQKNRKTEKQKQKANKSQKQKQANQTTPQQDKRPNKPKKQEHETKKHTTTNTKNRHEKDRRTNERTNKTDGRKKKVRQLKGERHTRYTGPPQRFNKGIGVSIARPT